MNANQAKLQKLAASEGYDDIQKMLEAIICDSISPAICVSCGFITSEMEPDQNQGYCEGCGENTVKSALILAGVI